MRANSPKHPSRWMSAVCQDGRERGECELGRKEKVGRDKAYIQQLMMQVVLCVYV